MPPSINMAYLELRLSGGAANADPNASLGGIMSSERVYSQSASAPTNCTGIAIDDGKNNALGDGTLSFIFSSTTATWTPNGETVGVAVDISVDGRYVLEDSTGEQQIYITVTNASLPGSDQSDTDITIADLANEIFDDIGKQESLDGDTEYRALYYYNAHPSEPILNVAPYMKSDAIGADSLSLAADLEGVGDGSTTGVADTIADENTAPEPALTFYGEKSVTSITRSGSTATVTLEGHGLSSEDVWHNRDADQSEYNGRFITTVIDADNFTFAVSGTPATPATGTIVGAKEVPLSSLDAAQAHAFWQERSVPLENTVSTAIDTSSFGVIGYT